MNILSFLIVLLILIPLTYYLMHDYKKGIDIAVFLLVSMTSYLFIETPGNFPNLTIHRLILIILFIVWITKNKRYGQMYKIPFFPLLVLVGITNLVSLLVSMDFTFSLKTYLSFTIEIILFYIIIITSMGTREDVFRMLNYICFALTIVALLAVIEKYTGFNLVDSYLPGYARKAKYTNDVMSTYPHRILLGTAMAMGWPVALVLADSAERNRFKYWISSILLLSACYFSFSRGPWLASIIAGLIVFILGSFTLKKKSMVIIILVIITLLIKPGVWETITIKTKDTMDPSSFKGQTYLYRFELWGVAYSEISKSIVQTLFGYGPGMSEVMVFERLLSYSGDIYDVWSWDNQYAADLLEGGFVGLTLVVILYIWIFKRLYSLWRKVDRSTKNIMAGIISSITAMLFMMTNVKIFDPQLNYLFWALVASGIILGSVSSPLERRIRMK